LPCFARAKTTSEEIASELTTLALAPIESTALGSELELKEAGEFTNAAAHRNCRAVKPLFF
jgi:hypothetical protein